MININAYAAQSAATPLAPFGIQRRTRDVKYHFVIDMASLVA